MELPILLIVKKSLRERELSEMRIRPVDDQFSTKIISDENLKQFIKDECNKFNIKSTNELEDICVQYSGYTIESEYVFINKLNKTQLFRSAEALRIHKMRNQPKKIPFDNRYIISPKFTEIFLRRIVIAECKKYNVNSIDLLMELCSNYRFELDIFSFVSDTTRDTLIE